MGIVHRIAEGLRSARDAHRDPAALLAAARRQRAALADVQHELDELADEKSYIEAEMARSRQHAARLDAAAAAAAAAGSGDIARDLRAERMQTDAFLAELAEARQAVADEHSRLQDLRKHLTDRLTEYDAPVRTADDVTYSPDAQTDRTVAGTIRLANEEAGLEADL